MISIIRAGVNPEMSSGSRTIDALRNEFSEAPLISCIRRLIIIKKIDPEEFEDGVNDMGEMEDFDLSPEELEALENEIPPEVDDMTMEELGLTEDDIDDLEGSEEEGDVDDVDMTDEEIAALEKEIPPEVDTLKDSDLEADPDLEEDSTSEETPDLAEPKETKKTFKKIKKVDDEDMDDYI